MRNHSSVSVPRAGKAVREELSRFVLRQSQMAPARSYQVEEFLQRKKEAMLNKFRAEGQLVSSRPDRPGWSGFSVDSVVMFWTFSTDLMRLNEL